MTSKYFSNCPKFYYINLDRSEERKTKLETEFNKYSISYQRIEAVDGNDLETWDHRLSKYEQGCTLSHFKAIETFYKTQEPVGIICEDDITFEFLTMWKTSIENILKNAPIDWEIIMISYIVWPNNSRFLVSNLYNPFVPLAHSGTGAYIINREGAKKILDKHNFNTPNLENYTKIRPVADVIIYDLVKTYVYKYCLFTFANDNVSTIHGVGSEQKHEITEHSTKKLARYIYSL